MHSTEQTSIDITFDFRVDSAGRDPDTFSATLKKYHQCLWSKPLPNGNIFNLQDGVSGSYLVHESGDSKFQLVSDSILHSYRDVKRMSPAFHRFWVSGKSINQMVFRPQTFHLAGL